MGSTVIIIPLICGPLGAYFEGDCIHVYYPQYLEYKAELSQLLCVDQQMFTSHCGEENIAVSVGTTLVSNILFVKSLLDKTTPNQL